MLVCIVLIYKPKINHSSALSTLILSGVSDVCQWCWARHSSIFTQNRIKILHRFNI